MPEDILHQMEININSCAARIRLHYDDENENRSDSSSHLSEESDLNIGGRERMHITIEFRVGKQKSVKVGNNYEAGNMIILVASFILVYFAERGRTEAPFLVAEVLEVITVNYPIRMKVWYYESYKRRNLIYGNGKFSRMNNNNDLDTGVCKGGKIPKNVKDIISTHVELNYSFGSNTVSESAKRRNTEYISSDESNELQIHLKILLKIYLQKNQKMI